MCVILDLPPSVLPTFHDFENAVYNNPHGYGIIMKAGGRMSVVKELVDEKDANPEAIYKILVDNKDAHRIVHLRFRTAGDISKENLHPFLVHSVGQHQTWFAHNGTFFNYKETETYQNGYRVITPESGRSDTLNFVERVLQPMFANFRMQNGHVDIHNEWLHTNIDKFWTGNSRGILVNNTQEPVRIGKWELIKGVDDVEFYASNNDYFSIIKRGIIFDAREAAKKREEEERRAKNYPLVVPSSAKDLVPISDRLFKDVGLSTVLADIAETPDFYKEKGLESLSFLSVEDVIEWVNNDTQGFASIFTHLAAEYYDLLKKSSKKGEVNVG